MGQNEIYSRWSERNSCHPLERCGTQVDIIIILVKSHREITYQAKSSDTQRAAYRCSFLIIGQ